MNDLFLKPFCVFSLDEIQEYAEELFLKLKHDFKIPDEAIITRDNRIDCKGQIENGVILYNTKKHVNLIDLYWTIIHEFGHFYYEYKDNRKDTEYNAENFAITYLMKYYSEYRWFYVWHLYDNVISETFKKQDYIHWSADNRVFKKHFMKG